jgi:hypothetical protein
MTRLSVGASKDRPRRGRPAKAKPQEVKAAIDTENSFICKDAMVKSVSVTESLVRVVVVIPIGKVSIDTLARVGIGGSGCEIEFRPYQQALQLSNAPGAKPGEQINLSTGEIKTGSPLSERGEPLPKRMMS